MSSPFLLLLIAAFLGALLSAAFTTLIRRFAWKKNLVDLPGGHKAHLRPVALGGGIAILLAVVGPMAAATLFAGLWHEVAPAWLPQTIKVHLGGIHTKTPLAWGIIGAASAACLVGFWDDLRPRGALFKLLVQVAIAAFLAGPFKLRLLTHLGAGPSTLISILWMVTLMNSLNFLDNMDGLAGGVAAIAAAVFALAAHRDGQVFVPVCCALFAGALAGFLPFNFYPASIYMGDAGSLTIGLFLAVLTILTTFADPTRGQQPIGVLAPLVVMAVPLYDTASVIYLRWRQGSPIWSGDRRHFSHRLLRRGMSVPQAVCVIWLATLVTALPALWLATASWTMAWGIALQAILVIALVALLESSGPGGKTRNE